MNSLPTQKFKAVLFDKDGTLLNSIPFWASHTEWLIRTAVVHFAGNLEPAPQKELTRAVLESVGIVNGKLTHDALLAGATEIVLFTQIFNTMIASLGASALPTLREFKHWCHIEINTRVAASDEIPDLYPGALDVLHGLKKQGYILGLATSDHEKNTMRQFTVLGIQNLFDWFGCVDTVSIPKPNGAGLREFASALNIAPEEILMVGDTTIDEDFARDGGAGAFWAIAEYSEAEKKFRGPDRILRSVKEISIYEGTAT